MNELDDNFCGAGYSCRDLEFFSLGSTRPALAKPLILVGVHRHKLPFELVPIVEVDELVAVFV